MVTFVVLMLNVPPVNEDGVLRFRLLLLFELYHCCFSDKFSRHQSILMTGFVAEFGNRSYLPLIAVNEIHMWTSIIMIVDSRALSLYLKAGSKRHTIQTRSVMISAFPCRYILIVGACRLRDLQHHVHKQAVAAYNCFHLSPTNSSTRWYAWVQFAHMAI